MDPKLFKTISEMDAYTRKQLFIMRADIKKAFEQHVKDGEVVDEEGLYAKFGLITASFIAGFAAGFVLYQSIATRRALDSSNEKILKTMSKYATNSLYKTAVNDASDKAVAKIGRSILNRKFPGTELSTAGRIKNIQKGTEQTLRSIVKAGMRDGRSTWEIAKELEAYVKPNPKGLRVSPWSIARREQGKPISFIPKNVPAGSVEYNAMRIARTETAFTYQQAPYEAHKDKWYYQGVRWMLSPSHKHDDDCDVYASHNEGIGKGVWRKPPRIPHSHCFCVTAVVTVPAEEMVRMFKLLNW